MIKINKNTTDIPKSLKSRNTQEKLSQLCEEKKFIYENRFEQVYKNTEIKKKLKTIYNNKCVYCEQKVEQIHVEHYRPKSKYWWLAYSWDNLLLACPTCNQNKGNNFEILKDKINFEHSDLKQIHNLIKKYDKAEEPKFFNPEQTDPKSHIIFDKEGTIKSNNERLEFTIEKCKLNRDYLKDERRRLFDIMIRNYKARMLLGNEKTKLEIIYSVEKDNQFIAYRKFCNKVLKYYLKQLYQ